MNANLWFKTIITVLGLTLFQNAISQTATDFTVTDSDGVTRSLYKDHLDKGQVVMVKVFFVACPPCNAIAPDVQALYEKWGSGSDKVEFIELSDKSFDDDDDVKGYKAKHSLTFPSVSAAGGSLDAVSEFKNGTFGTFSGTPTFVIIAPDGTVEFDPVNLEAVDAAIQAATMIEVTIPDCPTTDVVITSVEEFESYKEAYPRCKNFEGNFTISANVNNLEGLESLESIVGSLDINSTNLSSLAALSGLKDVTEKLTIRNSQSLNNLDGLSGLNNFSGDLEIINNSNIQTLLGLNNLTRVSGSLVIENNPKLTNLFALTNLSNVQNLTIRNNNSISSLDGLESLTNVGLTFTIRDNTSLTDISALSNFTNVSTFTLVGNTSLESCTLTNLCDLLFGSTGFVVSNISGNGTSCDSKANLEAACFPVEELPSSFAIQVLDAFDKPVAGVPIYVKSTSDGGANEKIGESDASGLVDFQLPNANISDFDNLFIESQEPSNSNVSGVSGVDIIRLQNHVLGITPITNPYALIAADANGSGSASASDLVVIINVILGKQISFPGDKVYKVLSQECIDSNTNCTNIPIDKSPGNTRNITIRAIRLGDING